MTDRHTTPVRRLAALVAGIMAGFGALTAPAALATSPEPTKLAFSGSFTETDFCGTGAAVAIESSFHGTLFNAPNQAGLEFWLTHSGRGRVHEPRDGTEGDVPKCRHSALVVRARRRSGDAAAVRSPSTPVLRRSS